MRFAKENAVIEEANTKKLYRNRKEINILQPVSSYKQIKPYMPRFGPQREGEGLRLTKKQLHGF